MTSTVMQFAKDEDGAGRDFDINHPKTIRDGKAIVPFIVRRYRGEPAWAIPGGTFTTDEATARAVAANMKLMMK